MAVRRELGKWCDVVWILLAMLVILLLAGVVVVYVAFPHRGESVPRTPWLGRAMSRVVHRLPTLHNQRHH